MREVHNMIFLGNGKFSDRSSRFLHGRLERGLEILSGLQQGPDPGNLDVELHAIVEDLAMGLLGKPITFGERVEYPGNRPAIDHSHLRDPVVPDVSRLMEGYCTVCEEDLGYVFRLAGSGAWQNHFDAHYEGKIPPKQKK